MFPVSVWKRHFFNTHLPWFSVFSGKVWPARDKTEFALVLLVGDGSTRTDLKPPLLNVQTASSPQVYSFLIRNRDRFTLEGKWKPWVPSLLSLGANNNGNFSRTNKITSFSSISNTKVTVLQCKVRYAHNLPWLSIKNGYQKLTCLWDAKIFWAWSSSRSSPDGSWALIIVSKQ